jgi:CHAT domain-containing protein
VPARVVELRLHAGSIVDANARALVLGVFRNVDPSGPAAAVDAALGGAIREFTLRRMFNGHLGQVFVMPAPRGALLAEMVLFAGLGEFDDFGPDAQAFAAENVVRTFAHTHVEDFATVPFGAGSGLPVALAVEQQLRGFMAGLRHGDPEHVVRRITLCELDRRKYAALAKAARAFVRTWQDAAIRLVVDESLPAAPVARPARPRSSELAQAAARRADPCYLLVTFESGSRGAMTSRGSLLTAGAKAAVLAGAARFTRRELDDLLAPLEQGLVTPRDLARIGAQMARLLLAPSVREGLAALAARPVVVVHDREASRVPWEVLRAGTSHPALAGGLSRRYASDTLSVARWRDDRAPGDPLRVLLVVDPTQDLPGAAQEGRALQQQLAAGGVTVDVLEGSLATRARLLATLGSGAFDVLHFAGHAFFDAADPGRGGLLCAGKEVLRGADLESLGNLPALVFCNACEAARVRRRATRGKTTRSRLFGLVRSSAGVAEAFLAGGVANFLGTHWPVGDEAAAVFSTRLYDALLRGTNLGDAVLDARLAVAETGSLDWADYVHYGNAEFRLAVSEP